jgi:hypothetical protein
MALADPFTDNTDKYNLIMAVENNLISIFCATDLNRFPCFRLVSCFTGHTSTNYDKIHKMGTTLLTCKRAPSPPPFIQTCPSRLEILRHITLHWLWLSSSMGM